MLQTACQLNGMGKPRLEALSYSLNSIIVIIIFVTENRTDLLSATVSYKLR